MPPSLHQEGKDDWIRRASYRQRSCCWAVFSCSVVSNCDPTDCSPPGSSVHRDSPGKNTGVVCHALLWDLPNPGIKPRFPALQVDSSEPPGRPRNTGLGKLSLLQGFLLTQELDWYLLHCRRIHLSHWGGPGTRDWVSYPSSTGSS